MPDVVARAIQPTNTAVSPGAVIFLNRSACQGAISHLVNRPLIVVKVMDGVPVSQILCISTGSSGSLPGIVIHLQSKNGWIGGKQTSFAYPWSFISVTPRDIREITTYIKEDVLNAIDRAIAYHMGFSDEIPPYLDMESRQVEYYRPDTSTLAPSKISPELDPNLVHVDPVKVTKTTPALEMNAASIYLRADSEEQTDEDVPEENPIKADTNSEPESADDNIAPVKDVKISKNLTKVLKDMTDSEIAFILSRTLTTVQIGQKYGMSGSDGARLRAFIEHSYVTTSTFKDIFRKTRSRAATNALSEIEQVIAVTYMDEKMLKLSSQTWKIFKDAVVKAYGIDFSAHTWAFRRAFIQDIKEQWEKILPSMN